MAFLKRKKPSFQGGGLALFPDVQQAMAAEKALKNAGYEVKLVAPPPELRKGCDLALEVNLTEKPGIERVLNERNIAYVSIVPLKPGTSELLEIVKVTDFGQWAMVKAGNMKLSFEKKSGIIVNTSGGRAGRQLFLSAEGDGDAAMFVLGMLVGAAFAHNFNAASSTTGPAPFGPVMVIVGLMVCIVIGPTMRESQQ